MEPSGRLTRQLMAALALGLGLVSMLFLLLVIRTYHAELARERGNASDQVSRLLQVSLENAMLKRDLPGLQEIVGRLGQQPGIDSVRILDPSREVRFTSDHASENTVMAPAELGCPGCSGATATEIEPSTQLVIPASGREVLRTITPIRNRAACEGCHGAAADHPINGILVVDHAADGIRSEALRAAMVLSGAGVLVVLAGLAITWAIVSRKVLAPVMALDGASRALAAGDLAARVDVRADPGNELQDLCHSFNAMAQRLQSGVEAVRQSQAFLQALIDTVPDGVRVIDESYRVVMANAAYARQLGAEGAVVTGVPCWQAHGRADRCPPTLETCPFHAITSDGQPIRYVHRHIRSDGTELYVETTAARLKTMRDGRPATLIVEAIRDLEQQVKYSHEQRLAEIGQLAAGVAHEIYNPLASVRLGLQAITRRMAAGAPLDEDARGYLAAVDGEVDKCISITRRLLDLSQPPSSAVQLVSFSNVVPEVLSLLSYDAAQRGVTVACDLGDEDLRVLATDAELRMLVLNLAQNAFHAMPEGGAFRIRGRYEGKHLVLVFEDTGVGIPAEALAHVFEPFFSMRADGVSGTGLGLTICRAIVTRYGGDITVESRPGEGARFRLVLPRPEHVPEHGEDGA